MLRLLSPNTAEGMAMTVTVVIIITTAAVDMLKRAESPHMQWVPLKAVHRSSPSGLTANHHESPSGASISEDSWGGNRAVSLLPSKHD